MDGERCALQMCEWYMIDGYPLTEPDIQVAGTEPRPALCSDYSWDTNSSLLLSWVFPSKGLGTSMANIGWAWRTSTG